MDPFAASSAKPVEVVDGVLLAEPAERAAVVARSATAPSTRETYATTYRDLAAFLEERVGRPPGKDLDELAGFSCDDPPGAGWFMASR